MPNTVKAHILEKLSSKFGRLKQLPNSRSLFVVGNADARVYVRYSKIHSRGKAFYGLRQTDLQQLEGFNSFVCFLSDDNSEPLFVPYVDFEDVFHTAQPASDGQFKLQVSTQSSARDLYIAKQGHFNVEAYVGFSPIERSLESSDLPKSVDLTHGQVQTLIAGIGNIKGYEVYVPPRDVGTLDWELTDRFELRRTSPRGFGEASAILSEIDVVWVTSGRNEVQGLFEIEHSTPIYSGLLRFNDVLLISPRISRFVVVSNDGRRELFVRQARRPTFTKSGLAEMASFLDYANVIAWHSRVRSGS